MRRASWVRWLGRSSIVVLCGACSALLGLTPPTEQGGGAPGFTLAAPIGKVSVIPGDAAGGTLAVNVARTGGFAGTVDVTVSGLPAGVTVDPLSVTADQTTAQLVFHASASATQADGTITVNAASGAVTAPAVQVELLVRGPAGTLDLTFGNAGVVLLPLGSDAEARGVAIEDDGKIVITGKATVMAADRRFVARFDGGGGVDPTFSSTGIKVEMNAFVEQGNAIAIQDLTVQGKRIVVVGNTQGSTEIVAYRYLFSGLPDQSFGQMNDGRVTAEVAGAGATANALAVQGEKLILTGTTTNGFAYLERLGLNGAVDIAFGPNGDGELLGMPAASGNSVAIGGTAGGTDILGVGTRGIGNGSNLFLVRTTADGMPLFPGGAIVVNRQADDGAAGSFAGAGGFYVAGFDGGTVPMRQMAVFGFKDDGTPDDGPTGFGSTGDGVTRVAPEGSFFECMALDAGGAIVAAGFVNDTTPAAGVVRFSPAGNLDMTFGVQGISVIGAAAQRQAQAIAIQPDGRIVIVGFEGGAMRSIFLARLWN